MTEAIAGALTRASVIGLGRTGAPLAACLGAAGLEVVGVDIDRAKVDAVNAGRPPVDEPGLAALMGTAPALHAMCSLPEAVLSTDITFLAVPTPAEDDGSLSLRHLLPVCGAVGAALTAKDSPHIVAITS